ncbi:MAG: hypothetical protein AAF456_25900 [Planctomycetota bacterium]
MTRKVIQNLSLIRVLCHARSLPIIYLIFMSCCPFVVAQEISDEPPPFSPQAREASSDPFASGRNDTVEERYQGSGGPCFSEARLTSEEFVRLESRLAQDALMAATRILEQYQSGQLQSDGEFPCRSNVFIWASEEVLAMAAQNPRPVIRSVIRHSEIKIPNPESDSEHDRELHQHMVELDGHWYRNGEMTVWDAMPQGLLCDHEESRILDAANRNPEIADGTVMNRLESGLYYRDVQAENWAEHESAGVSDVRLQIEVAIEFQLADSTDDPLTPVGVMRFCINPDSPADCKPEDTVYLLQINTVRQIESAPVPSLEKCGHLTGTYSELLGRLFKYDSDGLIDVCRELISSEESKKIAAPFVATALASRRFGDNGRKALIEAIGATGQSSDVFELVFQWADEETLPAILHSLDQIAEREGLEFPVLESIDSVRQFDGLRFVIGYRPLIEAPGATAERIQRVGA